MGSFSIWHWMIVLVVVVLIFGTKKLGNIGKDLGEGIKGFKQGMKDSNDEPPAQLRNDQREASAEHDGSKRDSSKPGDNV